MKSFHLKFSSSKSKINSILKVILLKNWCFDHISLEEFHTDSGSSNSEESLKNGSSVLFEVYSEIHEHTNGK